MILFVVSCALAAAGDRSDSGKARSPVAASCTSTPAPGSLHTGPARAGIMVSESAAARLGLTVTGSERLGGQRGNAPLSRATSQASDDLNIGQRGYIATTVVLYRANTPPSLAWYSTGLARGPGWESDCGKLEGRIAIHGVGAPGSLLASDP
jgi:hypothetical protein